jgi:hypothetical protein
VIWSVFKSAKSLRTSVVMALAKAKALAPEYKTELFPPA